jgi:hypothetical protein
MSYGTRYFFIDLIILYNYKLLKFTRGLVQLHCFYILAKNNTLRMSKRIATTVAEIAVSSQKYPKQKECINLQTVLRERYPKRG